MAGDQGRILVSPPRVGFGRFWAFRCGNTYENRDGVLFFHDVTGMITLDSFASHMNVHVLYMRCALSKYQRLKIHTMSRFAVLRVLSHATIFLL